MSWGGCSTDWRDEGRSIGTGGRGLPWGGGKKGASRVTVDRGEGRHVSVEEKICRKGNKE